MTPGHQHTPPGQLSVVEEVKFGRKNKMPAKLKPSTKEYVRDVNNRITNKWFWKHYTVSATSTENLKKFYTDPNYRKKKNVILKELKKRNEEI